MTAENLRTRQILSAITSQTNVQVKMWTAYVSSDLYVDFAISVLIDTMGMWVWDSQLDLVNLAWVL